MKKAEKMNVLLIAAGFDLNQASAFIDALRGDGQAVSVVGLTVGPVRSSSGVRLLPDTDLDRAPGGAVGMVVLPDGAECAIGLARDPRVRRYLRAVQGAGGEVRAGSESRAAMPDVEMVPLAPE